MEDCLPVIEINCENFARLWQTLNSAIKNASFIAIDCELSGLGNRKKLNFSEIDLRYCNTADIAREYSIVSLGLSCFTLKSVSNIKLSEGESQGNSVVQSQDYLVQTFNILTLCKDPFMVETASLKFLLNHGFDFNKLYAQGILYQRGDDQLKMKPTPCVRDVFTTILRHRKPIVVHNGFVDLVFLYQNFYLELPKNIEMFASDLANMFPSGVYDTKYIVEFFQKLPATYLEFMFKKMQLKNESRRRRGEWHVHIAFPPYPHTVGGLNWHPYRQIHSQSQSHDGRTLCDTYKYHGNCPKGASCEKSHDVNRIVRELDPEPKKRKKAPGVSISSVAGVIQLKSLEQSEGLSSPPRRGCRRTRKQGSRSSPIAHEEGGLSEGDPDPMEGEDIGESCERLQNGGGVCDDLDQEAGRTTLTSPPSQDGSPQINPAFGVDPAGPADPSSKTGSTSSGHRAGFDAFMTGFIFASQVSALGELRSSAHCYSAEDIGMERAVNKVYLVGKGFPFLVRQGCYAKTSQNHLKKIRGILGNS